MYADTDEAPTLDEPRLDKPNQRGAGLVEYALLVGLIAVVCIAAVALFGGATADQFSSIGDSLN